MNAGAPVAIATLLAASLLTVDVAATEVAPPPPPEPPHRLRFEEVARPVGPADILVTGLLLGTWIGLQTGVPLASTPRWTDVGGFDASVRRGIVAETAAGRRTAAAVSDAFWITPMIWAVADGAVVPLVTDRGNTDAAWQLTVINTGALSLAGIFARGGQLGFARRRPDVVPCQRDEDYHANRGAGSTASFPSGHATGAMAGAGLVCAHHAGLPLYGGGIPDIGACVIAASMGFSSGVLRLVADRHYVTDVIVGDLLGFGAGFGLPMLLHYHAPWYEPERPGSARFQILPSAPEALGGASVVGVW